MKIIFEKVRFKNFMSFGNTWTEIVFNEHPTTLVVGKNGSGKSSAILDAISFGLFNKPFRNINKPQLSNSINNKDCLVEVYFKAGPKNVKVIRGLKPNIFEIYMNGELLLQLAGNIDQQQQLERYILKVNHKTFCQIVALGSAIFKPFMSLSSAERRDVIEDLLSLKIFTTMNGILKSKMGETEETIKEIEFQQKLLEERKEMTAEYIEKMKASNERMIADKQVQIDETNLRIKGLDKEYIKIKESTVLLLPQVEGEEKYKAKYSEYEKLEARLEQKLQNAKREIKFLNSNEVCSTCHQNIDKDFKEKSIHDHTDIIEELQIALEELAIKKEETWKILHGIWEARKQLGELNSNKNQLTTNHTFYVNKIIDLQKEIIELQTVHDEATENKKIEDLEAELTQLSTQLIDMEEDKMVQAYAASLLKDNGIKSRIISLYIPFINQVIQTYLAKLDFFVEFTLNESFEETIRSRYRDLFSYESFSEGEKMRLNIAILFTWRAIAKQRASFDTNLIIMDEILDGSLDADGIDKIMHLILNLTEGQNIVIISHKLNYLDKFSRVLEFEKIKSFSQIKVR